MIHRTLTLGDRSARSFDNFLGNAHFRGNPFVFPNYFLALHVPLWNRHNERRLLRFGFDIPENLGNFQLQVKNKATVDAPWVCYIHTCYALIAIGVSVHQWNYRYSGLLYLSAWGFDVARFDLQGPFLGASGCGASDSSGLHAFFMS